MSEEEKVRKAFENGALAVTIIDGKMAPWTPFGVEVNPREFSRGKQAERKTETKGE